MHRIFKPLIYRTQSNAGGSCRNVCSKNTLIRRGTCRALLVLGGGQLLHLVNVAIKRFELGEVVEGLEGQALAVGSNVNGQKLTF